MHESVSGTSHDRPARRPRDEVRHLVEKPVGLVGDGRRGPGLQVAHLFEHLLLGVLQRVQTDVGVRARGDPLDHRWGWGPSALPSLQEAQQPVESIPGLLALLGLLGLLGLLLGAVQLLEKGLVVDGLDLPSSGRLRGLVPLLSRGADGVRCACDGAHGQGTLDDAPRDGVEAALRGLVDGFKFHTLK